MSPLHKLVLDIPHQHSISPRHLTHGRGWLNA
jgi:hypothetical protein